MAALVDPQTLLRDLFVLDIANNHQGDLEHALNIIRSMGETVRKNKVKAGLKFQFRQLDTFIHPDHHKGSEAKHIKRFLSTRMDRSGYQKLLNEVRHQGLLAICTPFDEESVDVILDMDFDIIKVASCSARDWPLLEKIADADKPVIFSTGGLEQRDIDNLVSFFDNRGVDYAIMHCVSIYPTPDEFCHMNQIDMLKRRYRNRVIGWSTHENPNDTVPVQIAVAKGAEMFERHVGIETDKIKLNAYSSTPDQVDKWMTAYTKAKALCGSLERPPVSDIERDSIDSLRRGVYAKKPIKAGSKLTRDLVYFAMPYNEDQLSSNDWNQTITALTEIVPNAPVITTDLNIPEHHETLILKHAIHEVKALFNEAHVPLNSEFMVEYSHHYGIKKFRETGAVLVNCINRAYCKKIIAQLPGQKHPMHYHALKEETFQVLHGELQCIVDGHKRSLYPGDTQLVQPGVWHSFWTDTGCVFEEVSTTDHKKDSYYKDKKINVLERYERKTIVDHWGRFQLPVPPEISVPKPIEE